jgi:hypothetical protein
MTDSFKMAPQEACTVSRIELIHGGCPATGAPGAAGFASRHFDQAELTQAGKLRRMAGKRREAILEAA